MANPKCYVMGCKSGYEASKERIFFFKPRDLKTLKLWDEFIGRKDVKLQKDHSVCHKHFQDKDVIKTLVKNQNLRSQPKDRPPPKIFRINLAVGAVPKLLTGKPNVETPRPPLPEVKKTVQCGIPQPLILRKVSKENVINCKDPAKRPILIDKSVRLVKSSDIQALQNVSPAAQKITNHQPAVTINYENPTFAINQQTPPVGFLIQRVQNNTVPELRKVSSISQPYIVNPKDATLPPSWFWQEGSLREEEFICSKFKWLDENKFEYTKSVIIDRDTGTLRFFVRGQQVFHEKLKYQFLTINQLIDCLRFYDKIPECVGYSDPKSADMSEISASPNLQTKSGACETRSKNCLLLGFTNSNACRNCMKEDPNFRKNIPKQTAIGSKKTCDIPPRPLRSESPVTYLNLDENPGENYDDDEPQVVCVLLDHSYGSMTSQSVLDKRPTKISKCFRQESENEADEENDQKDLELAKEFLKNERNRKHALRKQLNRDLKMLEKSKTMACAILKAWKKLQQKMKEKAKRPKYKYPLTPCNLCGRMVRVARMHIHLKIHGGFKPYSCEICSRAFANKSSLKSHVRFNHLGEPKPYMCSTCGHTCRNKKTLTVHEMSHTDEKPWECPICDKRYRTKTGLKIHTRSHTGEKPYICKFCGISYAHSKTLKRHLHRHHENVGPDGIVDPSIRYVWKKKGPKGANPGGKRYPCTICEKNYSDKKTLRTHMQRYHEPGESDAAYDPVTRTRMRIRKEIPGYRCEFCQKEFCRILAFERHRSTHTGKAVAVPCPQPNCDFTYSSLKELKDHLVAQHPDKGFTCDKCGKIFLSEVNLDLHQAAHDASLGFQCSYCPLRSTTMSGLRKHEKIHLRDKSTNED